MQREGQRPIQEKAFGLSKRLQGKAFKLRCLDSFAYGLNFFEGGVRAVDWIADENEQPFGRKSMLYCASYRIALSFPPWSFVLSDVIEDAAPSALHISRLG